MAREIVDRLSVADAAAILAFPPEQRAQLMSLVRSAYFAGYDAARECSESDAMFGFSWAHVDAYRSSCAGLWLTANAEPLLASDVGCEIDPIYSPTNETIDEPTPLMPAAQAEDGSAARVVLGQGTV